jgi:hypothetical protein
MDVIRPALNLKQIKTPVSPVEYWEQVSKSDNVSRADFNDDLGRMAEINKS